MPSVKGPEGRAEKAPRATPVLDIWDVRITPSNLCVNAL
jgi:hypothetical protein